MGECSVTCGGGKRRNTRMKIVEERDEGKCEGASVLQEECNFNACPSK